MCPSASFKPTMITARVCSGLGAIPPYVPECRSCFAPRTSTSVYTMPRSPLMRAGVSFDGICVSQINAASHFKRSAWLCTYASTDSPPASSSPSISTLILMGKVPLRPSTTPVLSVPAWFVLYHHTPPGNTGYHRVPSAQTVVTPTTQWDLPAARRNVHRPAASAFPLPATTRHTPMDAPVWQSPPHC